MASKVKDRIIALAARAQAEEAQGLAEYGLILGLVALACIAGLTVLGETIAGSRGFVEIPGSL